MADTVQNSVLKPFVGWWIHKYSLWAFWNLEFVEFGEFYKPKNGVVRLNFWKLTKQNKKFQKRWGTTNTEIPNINKIHIKNSCKQMPLSRRMIYLMGNDVIRKLKLKSKSSLVWTGPIMIYQVGKKKVRFTWVPWIVLHGVGFFY